MTQTPATPPPPPRHDQPFIVQVAPQETPKQALGDVIVGAFGLTGALVLGALVAGALVASVWILWRKFRRPYDTDAPPSLGSVPIGKTNMKE
jgi:hypothetical protein